MTTRNMLGRSLERRRGTASKPSLTMCGVSGSQWLLSGLFLLAAGAAFPQQPPTGGQLLQTVPQGNLPIQPGSRNLELERRLQKARGVADVEGLQIDISSFVLTGLTVLPSADIEEKLTPFLGPKKNFQTLLDAASKVKEVLAAAGYFLADVVVPEQSIRNGRVELLILEGRLGKIKLEVEADVPVKTSLIESYLSPLEEGQIIRAGTVERALFLISDLKGLQIRSLFEPGEKIGTADLTIKVSKAKRIDGNVDFDSHGSTYTGVFRTSAGVDVGSPLKRGDLLSLRYLTDTDRRGMQYARVSYLTPLGPWGTKVGLSYSDLQYELGTAVLDPLKASGYAFVGSALMLHPFIRSRNRNLMGIYQFDRRKFHDLQRTANLETDKYTHVSTYAISGDERDSFLGGGVNVYNVAWTHGRLDFATDASRAADRASRDTLGNYAKFNLSYSRLQRVSDGTALYFSYSHQFARKNLDLSEKFSLGGPNAVRAYPQGEGAGDEGFLSTVEARIRVPLQNRLPGNMTFAVFHDVGWARLNKVQLPTDTSIERRIAGWGVGLNWEAPGNWFVRSSVSWRDTAKPQAEHTLRDPRIFLQASKFF